AGITVSGTGLGLRYVLDFAEIPAFQERQVIDANGDGRTTPGEEAAYLAKKVPALLRGLSLEVDGGPAALAARGQRLVWAPGAGGLRTLRLEVDAVVPAARLRTGAAGKGGWHIARYRDGNLPARTGWKEVVVTPLAGGVVTGSTAPAVDRSHALSAYPKDLLSSPPQDLSAQFRFSVTPATAMRPPGPAAGIGVRDLPRGGPGGGRDDLLTRLIHRRSFPIAFLPLALLIAFGLGCLHALSPGHGKTMVGAYLVGSRGTPWHAVLLGVTVTL